MYLDQYEKGSYSVGASLFKQIAWYLIGAPLVRCEFLPWTILKCTLLRVFGAEIGKGVRIKPRVRVKFPWRLKVGDYTWIGEGVWIDNVAEVSIASHSCISQGVYICSGDHIWNKQSFDLAPRPVKIGSQVWIAASCCIAPGTQISDGVVVTIGSMAHGVLEEWTIYQGNPAKILKKRQFHDSAVKA